MSDHPPPPQPPEDVQEISTPEQFSALAHPLRQRLLFSLGHRPATIGRLAEQLGTTKGNVAHHLKVLREAGLVHIAETRRVRGGTEQHYQRTARRMIVAEPQEAGTAAMLTAVAQELDRSPADTHLTLRHVRLGPAKARELGEALAQLVDEVEDDPDEGQPTHGVLVALYQRGGDPVSADTPGQR
ncbi:ArsR/SmtB family transcription factor [Streptomyces sp. NBC_00859]|uniref:ArsR/SmtB family transcription factor n=1 Tax=Streptomyces sp. NBC_00859 TaxID=2903682 RepID=UPI003864941E|nr:winged helix-turn-helix domain-containing protein [Streptomyces sp. NBC_00859]